MTTTLEKYLVGFVVALIAAGSAVAWWIHHNHAEQNIGAQACIQSTTVDKTEAHADVVSTQAAQAVDINAVVQGYETKVASLSRSNDDLARRLLASGAVRQNGVPDTGSAAGANCSLAGLPAGESQAAAGLAATIRADVDAVLAACDANQVKTEDAAKIYNGVRDRAIAAAAKLKAPSE